MSIKQTITYNLKNIRGWNTNRKIVVFSIDDYGNVRLDSKKALEAMEAKGIKPLTRYDRLDTLETKEDLQHLYEVLSSVKDKNGRHATFTAFALCANINFEKMAANGYNEYESELLPETFSKLKGYEGTWDLWKEGMDKKLLVPQFHGREHLNLPAFERALKAKDERTLIALENRSYANISSGVYPSYTAAFEFVDFSENEKFKEIIKDGLNKFEQVFGYRASHFNSPGGSEHHTLHATLKDSGIKYLDVPAKKKEYQGNNKFATSYNYTGKKNDVGQLYMIRNVLFEPTSDNNTDWAELTFKQIEAAFRWNKPAVISSHRVNFCGHVDENNRKAGLQALGKLLKKIVTRWPEVEFMAANELGDLITSGKK